MHSLDPACIPRLLASAVALAAFGCGFEDQPYGVDGGADVAASSKADDLTKAPGARFTVAVLPDTQHYVEWWKRNTEVFRAQTRWLAENARDENIAFVTHVGDIVENGNVEFEWRRASRAMDLLDGAVRYSTLPGNHDYRKKNQRLSGAPHYVTYFGRRRYGSHPWATLSPNQRNSVQRFHAGGRRFLHIALEWEANDNTLGWAQGVINRNRGVPTIVSTHAFLNIHGNPALQSLNPDANSGKALWREFISKNDQIFMVLNGHFADASRSVLHNDRGQRVFAMLADYSFDLPRGGNGFLRLIEFDTRNHKIRVRTYSPYRDRFLEGPKNQFSFEFNLDRRFGPAGD